MFNLEKEVAVEARLPVVGMAVRAAGAVEPVVRVEEVRAVLGSSLLTRTSWPHCYVHPPVTKKIIHYSM